MKTINSQWVRRMVMGVLPFYLFTFLPLQATSIKSPNGNVELTFVVEQGRPVYSMTYKGREVIEARRLFEESGAEISVVVHPESLIHSLVRTSDGILYAQISEPDMRHPIMGALCWPEYVESGLEKFSLAGRSMSFFEPRRDDFPLLAIAEDAAKKRGSETIAFNAQ